MKEKFSYIFPILIAFVLMIVSSCRNTDDSAYYYSNSTGAGNGNTCCGCNNNSDVSDNSATPYCEPEAPELVACPDNTITINAFSGVSFATQGDCKDPGQYFAASGGIMTLDGKGGLQNPDGKSLLWKADGSSEVTSVMIPFTIESMQVLPEGTIMGYTNGVGTALGKLLVVNTSSIGECGDSFTPSAAIGKSILWCKKRVCSSLSTGGEVRPLPTFVAIKSDISPTAYITLDQSAFSKEATKLYATGVKDLAVDPDGLLIEKETCMPVLDPDDSPIYIPRDNVTNFSISNNIILINKGNWGKIAVAEPEKEGTLIPIYSGGLSAGFKVPSRGLSVTMVPVDDAIKSIGTEQNVCIDSNTFNLIKQ